ncbi:MAG: hypothetical protein H0T66_20125 [Geodermatophilaceae bacterium]|nr:hypothetical protein [Geodermatophilaceae bacterium]MDQ3454227.1 hypothetical protein [Actinomycetota bacterium]
MPATVLTLTVLFAVPALALGVRKVSPPLRWDQRRRRMRRAEAVDRIVVIALRVGLLSLLLLLALVAVVGCIAALRADVQLPGGVVVACVGVALLSLLTLSTFARPRR